jgi:hypothetical protein
MLMTARIICANYAAVSGLALHEARKLADSRDCPVQMGWFLYFIGRKLAIEKDRFCDLSNLTRGRN